MRIAGTPIPVRDLTRWNRAGLEHFRYVEGGAAEWREYLRVAHLLLYAGNPGAAASDDPDIWRQGFEDGTLPGGVPIGTAMRALDSRWAQPAPQAYVQGAASYAAALRAQYDAVPLDHGAQISRAFVRAFHILTETLNAYANEGFLGTATQEPHLRRLQDASIAELQASGDPPAIRRAAGMQARHGALTRQRLTEANLAAWFQAP